jgi:hypothetical protein
MFARWRRRSRLRRRKAVARRSGYEDPYRNGLCAQDWTKERK